MSFWLKAVVQDRVLGFLLLGGLAACAFSYLRKRQVRNGGVTFDS